jgi:16S rRNA (guanine(527)-N(7))-methyltransferase RsmG
VVIPSSLIEEIQTIAGKFKVALSTEKQEQLLIFLKILVFWNQRVNLTGAKNAEEIVRDHLSDSFAMTSLVPPASTLVDVGSGGGLPAIPFAVLRPDCRIVMIEPRAKRTAFLHTALREIHCQSATVHRKRFEDIEAIPDAFYASKATFEPKIWLNLALPRSSSNGGVLVFCSNHENEIEVQDGILQNTIHYQTQQGTPRQILLYSKTSPNPETLVKA